MESLYFSVHIHFITSTINLENIFIMVILCSELWMMNVRQGNDETRLCSHHIKTILEKSALNDSFHPSYETNHSTMSEFLHLLYK